MSFIKKMIKQFSSGKLLAFIILATFFGGKIVACDAQKPREDPEHERPPEPGQPLPEHEPAPY